MACKIMNSYDNTKITIEFFLNSFGCIYLLRLLNIAKSLRNSM